MKVICSYCGADIELNAEDASSDIRCTKCGRQLPSDETLDFLSSTGATRARDDKHETHDEVQPTQPVDEQGFVAEVRPSRIGSYQILEQLGVGGAGQVFKALETKADRIVVLKVPAHPQQYAARTEQFLREARSASQLQHKYIVPLLDVGVEDGCPYIVNQYVDGATLRDWYLKHDLSPAEIAILCAKLADALDHAHSRGIVHRDLKPGNIIVDSLGNPHIVDFGIALDASSVADGQSNLVLGTPAYMSPEQARGESHVDGRADIYALGRIMVELLLRDAPSGDGLSRIRRQADDDRSPALDGAGIPRELCTICLKCLEHEPRDRYQAAEELAAALRHFHASTDGDAALTEQIARLRSRIDALQADLAKRTQMFVAAQAEHQLYRSLVEHLPLCVFRKNLAGEFVFANDAICEIANRSFDELNGKTSRDVFPAELASLHEDFEARVISTGQVISSVEEHVADREPRTFEVQRSPVRNFDGEIVGVQTIMWDVSAHTRAERALREAKEAAVTANQTKNHFLANMSHEIRTPMQSIIGFTGLLLGRPQDKENRERLQLIQQSANHLMVIIKGILDFSQIEAGGWKLKRVAFDVHTTIRDEASLFQYEAERKGVSLRCQIAADVPQRCLGDVTCVRQVLSNLLGNAVKFTNHGSVTLTAAREAAAVLGDGATGDASRSRVQLHLMVSDTGIGIPRDKRETIFQPFEQVDGSSTRAHGGTGLGLAICAQLVKLMEGEIWVESEEGQGSEFHVILCLDEAEHLPAEESAAEPPPENHHFAPLRVLLVEDHPISQKFAVQSLQEAGHAVTTASNGREAVELFEQGKFDVVLMDLQMPEMDGLAAARAIRAKEGPAEAPAPIIAVTAHATKEDRAVCFSAGMSGYLSKPVTHTELLKELARAAKSRRADDDGCDPPAPRRFRSFDPESLLLRVGHDRQFLQRTHEMFKEDYPRLEDEIREAIDQQEFERLARAAHKLNGVLRNFDALTTAGLLDRMESLARAGNASGIEEAWREARVEIARFDGELTAFLTDAKSPLPDGAPAGESADR